MPQYAIEFEYDGGAFAGTQEQRGDIRTLQSVLTAAVTQLEGAPTKVRLASRLDAGVSAYGLVGDVALNRVWEPATLGMALTSYLPMDVAVRRVAEMPDTWNAKTAARSKTYVYRVCRRNMRPVLDRRCWWLRRIDHPQHLPTLAAMLPGDRDLSGFACLRRDDSDEDDPHRRVLSTSWHSEQRIGEEIHTFTITGEGFLYKQVRGIVGAMLFVAQGRASVDEFIAAMAAGRNANRIGNIAPAEGLILQVINYDPAPVWITI